MSPLPSMLRGHRGRVLTATIAGLVVSGVLIGLGIAWVGTTALEAAGLDTSETTPPPTSPDPEPDPSAQPSADPSGGDPSTSPDVPSKPPPSTKPPPENPTLTAAPTQVGTYDDIALSGKFPGLAAGMALQIERRLDGGPWELFPVSLSSGDGGTFSTTVQTGQAGENDFRVSVPGSLLSTPTVSVLVG